MHGNKSDPNYCHEKIKSRLHLGNDCYHTVQNIWSSCLPYDNINLKIQKTKFLLFVLCGFENIASHILVYIQQDATLRSLFYLETALYVLGCTITHHQERKQLLSTASGICHTVIAICRYRGRVGTGLSVLWVVYIHSLFYLETALHVSGGAITHHQERKQLYLQHLVFVTPADSNNGVTNTRCCRYSCLRS